MDAEDPLRPDGERPNRQLRVVGDATLSPDPDGIWTARVRSRYLDARIAPGAAGRPPPRARTLITVTPRCLRAIASV